MEELTGLNSKGASTLMAQHLLAAADRYGMDRLRLICEANLCEDVAINTVATTLALAEQHHCFQLKSVCLKFVALPENLRGELLVLFCNSPYGLSVSLLLSLSIGCPLFMTCLVLYASLTSQTKFLNIQRLSTLQMEYENK